MAKIIEPVCVVDWEAIDDAIDAGYDRRDDYDNWPNAWDYVERNTFDRQFCNHRFSAVKNPKRRKTDGFGASNWYEDYIQQQMREYCEKHGIRMYTANPE